MLLDGLQLFSCFSFFLFSVIAVVISLVQTLPAHRKYASVFDVVMDTFLPVCSFAFFVISVHSGRCYGSVAFPVLERHPAAILK